MTRKGLLLQEQALVILGLLSSPLRGGTTTCHRSSPKTIFGTPLETTLVHRVDPE